MARALWKGAISFGLVSIPIELHTAVRNHRPKFRMLHAKDKSPVRFERVCVRDGQHLAAVEVMENALVLTVMRYADELVDTPAFGFPAAKDIRKPELEM